MLPQVLFGTADGQVIVMDCHGRMLAHVLLHESDGIVSMSWNCPDFLVEDSTESDTDSDDNILPLGTNTFLQCSFKSLLACADCLKLIPLYFFFPPSAESQTFVDSHLLIRRYQFNEQLWWPFSCHNSLRAERYTNPHFTVIFKYAH